MRYSAAVVLALFALTGCNRSQAPAAPPGSPSPTPPAPVGGPAPAPPTPATKPVAAAPAPVATATAEPAAPELEMPRAERPKPTPSPSSVCVRACNKSQRCAASTGSAAACIDACLAALAATDPEGQRDALAFRAQERCADVACDAYSACVSKAVVGEAAAAKAPPMAPEDAKGVCKKLCDKEQLCKPEVAAGRPGGMSTCLGTCVNQLVSTEDDAAVQRVLMKAAYECIDKPCEEFDPCVHEKVVPTPPEGKAGGK